MEVERDLTVECNFKEGLYIIYMEIDWIDDKIRDISLSAYTQNQIMLIELEIKPHLAEQILDALL